MDYFRSKTALFENSAFGRVKRAFAEWAEMVSSRVRYGVVQSSGRPWETHMGDMMANAIQYGMFMKTAEWDKLDFTFGLKDDKVNVRISFESRGTRERKSKLVTYEDTMSYDRVAQELVKECGEFFVLLPKQAE